ncbi:MAG: hypothetical protein JSV91_05975 [Phycisphaerales bacterium]|nr:MAG: hypothetical protein JSV91_05975 [Phycisphaerales bacterium]
MTRSLIGSRTAALILAAAGVAFSRPASSVADIDVDWVNEELYSVKITHVPDLDQVRSVLPNGGVSYCSPTSVTNWAGYFANHGLPALPPGPGNWESQLLYDDASQAIYNMGLAMFTDPIDGTNQLLKYAGTKAWFMQAGDNFVVSNFLYDDDWSPTAHFMCLAAMNNRYLTPSIGWYYEYVSNFIIRNGGHSVSLVSGERDGPLMKIGITDPGSNDDNTSQSPFTIEKYMIEDRFARPIEYGETRLMSKFVGYGGNGIWGYLEGFVSISPLFVLTTPPEEPHLIAVYHVMGIHGSPVPPVQHFPTPELVAIRSLALHPDLFSYVYVADNPDPGEPALVWRLDPVSGISRVIDLPFDDPREVMVSRRRDLYVRDGDDLLRVAIDVKPAREISRITPPSAVSAMAYEDETDELMLLSSQDQAVLRYLYHFDAEPVVKNIYPPIPLSENARICWDPTREAIWVVSDASNSLFMLTDSGSYYLQSDEYTHPVLIDPGDDIVAHDGGHIFVSCGGMLYEFDVFRDGLELVDDPHFPDAEAGEHLCIATSHTNYDEDLHSGEEWYDVLPDIYAEPTDDCAEDLNDDGTVDIDDLFAVLAAWGPCPPDQFCEADFDYSGEVDIDDIFSILAAWGPCAPIGACCLWDGTCLDLTADECAMQGDSIWLADYTCDTYECPDWPNGACCVDGECVETDTEYECALLGGNWYLDDDCTQFDCPTSHCDAWGDCGQYISRVRMGDVDNSSGCNTGYSDYTYLFAEVTVGYVLQIIVNTDNPQTGDVCGIWVDWDQDFVFDYPRDFVDLGDLSLGWWLTQIGAPPDAKRGPTRLRLCLVNNEDPDACGELGPGEVEDYTIVVVDDSPYCAAWAECDAYISRVQVGEIDNSSGCHFGYTDHTDLSTEISLDAGLEITITVGNSAGYEHGALFIDWNQDGVLGYPSEEVELEGSPGPGPYTATIIPPSEAELGPTRMRIRVSGEEDPPGPCGETETGETEDYTIIVVE